MRNWKKSILSVTFFILLCVLAAVGGYKGSRALADSITVQAEQNAEKAGLFRIPETKSNPEQNNKNQTGSGILRPYSLIYIVDYEIGKVEGLILEQLDTIGMSARFLYLDTDILYTMTPELYKRLVTGNVLLPQTVTFKELYSYYGNETVFDAGKKIVGELLGVEIDHYIVCSSEKVSREFKIERITSLGLKELYEESEQEITDISEEDRKAYLELCEYITDKDIYIYDAPVLRRNESCFADVNAILEILVTF